MGYQGRVFWKLAVAVVMAAIAILFVSSRYSHFRQAGESGAHVWFYDQQKKQLYAAARDTIPPEGHGVRAVVVAFRGEENQPTKRRIAYLETYGQPLKEVMERAKVARASGSSPKEPPLSRDSELFQTNNLVKQVEETEWHQVASPEGRRVMSAWRTWRAPDGREPVVCMP